MERLPPTSTLTDTLIPYTALFRSLLDALLRTISQLDLFSVRGDVDLTNAGAVDHNHIRAPAAMAPVMTRFVEAVRVFNDRRSEEHTSELQSLMRISYAVFFLKKTITYQSCHSSTRLNTYID